MEYSITCDNLLHCTKFSVGPFKFYIYYVMCCTNGRSYVKTETKRNNMQPTRSLYDIQLKSYGSNSDFHVFNDLDHQPILVIFLENADRTPGILHIKFCKNQPTFNKVWCDIGLWTHTHTQTDKRQHYNNLALPD